MKIDFSKLSLCVIGIGYVGLPLALEFSKYRRVLAYDYSRERINELQKGFDRTNEISKKQINKSKNISFTFNIKDIVKSNCFIICVPTPLNNVNKPDLRKIISATKLVARKIKKNNLIIYESTVYPGLTEEICVPLIEKISNLKYNKDFYCGYSPERINPGDKTKKISNVKKLVAGSNKSITNIIFELYNKINPNNIVKVKNIKIAEAAKVIENCQRDLNIAFMNELSIIFNKLGVSTNEVLKAAETKWNFGKYYPGLVGGHCIGVDPYYLSFKAKQVGYNPKIILSGREINNYMPRYVVKNLLKGMKSKKIKIKQAKILIMGLTFKENCPDTRNSKIFTIISMLNKFDTNIYVFDPWIDNLKFNDLNFNILEKLTKKNFDVVILAVAHNKFKKISINKLKDVCKKRFFLYDLKNFYNSKFVDLTL